MENGTSHVVKEYVKDFAKGIVLLGLSLFLAFGCVVMGAIPVYLLNLGVGDSFEMIKILMKILFPVIFGLIMITNVKGFVSFLTYRWRFVPDYNIYDSITTMWYEILYLSPIIVIAVIWYFFWRDLPSDITMINILVGIVVTYVIDAFLVGLFVRIRAVNYEQGIKAINES